MRPLTVSRRCITSSATIDGVGALALGDGEADRGRRSQLAVGVARHRPGAVVELGRADDDVGDVLDIDGPAVARGQQQEADVRNALQRLPGDDRDRRPSSRNAPTRKERLALVSLSIELLERHAVEREALRIGLDADLVRAAADDIGRADAVDLGQFVLQLLGDLVEAVVRPSAAPSGLAESVSTTIATSLMPRPTISGSGMPFGSSSMIRRGSSRARAGPRYPRRCRRGSAR